MYAQCHYNYYKSKLGRAAAPKRKGGAASGYPLQVLAAVVPPLLWAFRYYPSRWLTPVIAFANHKLKPIKFIYIIESTALDVVLKKKMKDTHFHC